MSHFSATTVASIFLFFLIFSTLLKFYLASRQARVLEAHRDTLPRYFTGKIALPDYQQAVRYSLDKLAFQQYSDFWQAFLIVLFTILGGLNLCAYLARGVTTSLIGQGLLIILLFLGLNYLLTLPFTIYEHFKLEEAYGFNKMTPGLFLRDQIKTILLAAVFLLPLITLVLYLLQAMGPYWWFYTWLVWGTLSLLIMAIFPRWIAPLFNTFTPLKDQELVERIKALLGKTGFTSGGVFVMDGSKRSGHANAYFTGFGRNKRIVFFDTLLHDMTGPEIEAILAHELGHFKLKHVALQLFVTLVLALVVLFILGQLIHHPFFYLGLGLAPEYINDGAGLVLFFLVLPLVTFVFSPLQNSLSRRHEYAADHFAAAITSPAALISALTKLYNQNAASLVDDPWYAFYYHSHPNAEARIEVLAEGRS